MSKTFLVNGDDEEKTILTKKGIKIWKERERERERDRYGMSEREKERYGYGEEREK